MDIQVCKTSSKHSHISGVFSAHTKSGLMLLKKVACHEHQGQKNKVLYICCTKLFPKQHSSIRAAAFASYHVLSNRCWKYYREEKSVLLYRPSLEARVAHKQHPRYPCSRYHQTSHKLVRTHNKHQLQNWKQARSKTTSIVGHCGMSLHLELKQRTAYKVENGCSRNLHLLTFLHIFPSNPPAYPSLAF